MVQLLIGSALSLVILTTAIVFHIRYMRLATEGVWSPDDERDRKTKNLWCLSAYGYFCCTFPFAIAIQYSSYSPTRYVEYLLGVGSIVGILFLFFSKFKWSTLKQFWPSHQPKAHATFYLFLLLCKGFLLITFLCASIFVITNQTKRTEMITRIQSKISKE